MTTQSDPLPLRWRSVEKDPPKFDQMCLMRWTDGGVAAAIRTCKGYVTPRAGYLYKPSQFSHWIPYPDDEDV